MIGAKSCVEESLVQLSPPKVEADISKDEDDESNSLLSIQEGQAPRRPSNPRRKVQWNDRNGHKLVEILEFQPR